MRLDGEKIRRTRELSGLTKSGAAQLAGISDTSWGRAESGLSMSPPNALRVAQALDMDLVDLVPSESERELHSA